MSQSHSSAPAIYTQVVVTAGAKQKPGQSRMDLAKANTAICRKLVPDLVRLALELGVLLAEHYPDGIWEVLLDEVAATDPPVDAIVDAALDTPECERESLLTDWRRAVERSRGWA